MPSPNEVSTSEATIVYWSDGKTELGRLGEATRRSVALTDVPLDAQHAVLAAEDRTFYEHGGVSPLGIGRAVINNLKGGSTQGGSTITQQYAKNAYLTQDRSWSRKAKELLLAFKLETVVSKDQILEDYLNTIYFGRGPTELRRRRSPTSVHLLKTLMQHRRRYSPQLSSRQMAWPRRKTCQHLRPAGLTSLTQ